jgi:ComEC/Rec2-related protein
MMVTRFVTLSLGFIGGIVLATNCRAPISGFVLGAASVAGAALSVIMMLREREWKEWRVSFVILAAALCAMPLGYWRAMDRIGPSEVGTLPYLLDSLSAGDPIQLRGVISAEPELRGSGQGDLRIRVDKIRLDTDREWIGVDPEEIALRVYAYAKTSPATRKQFDRLVTPEAYGYRVEVKAKYRPVEASRNPGEFDFASFLAQHNLVARFRCHVFGTKIVEESRGNFLTEIALETKRRFLLTYKQTIHAPASGLVAAATLGTRRAVEGVEFRGIEIVDAFRHAGVGHVLAVSGLHVSIVSLLLYTLFRMTGMRASSFAPVLVLFLVLFALLTGARPSSVRAVIMNSVIIVAFSYFHVNLARATYAGLAISSLIILVGSPIILFSPSFQLSFGAVLSLVLVSPPIERWLSGLRGYALLFAIAWFAILILLLSHDLAIFLFLPNTLAVVGLLWVLLVTGSRLNEKHPALWNLGLERVPPVLRMFLSAQLAIQFGMMLPLSAWFFGQFPIAGVFVNLLAIPAIGILVQLGMLTGLVGLIPVVGNVLAMPLGAAVTLVGQFFFWLAWSGATVFAFPATPRPPLSWMIGYYVVLAGMLVIAGSRSKVQGILYRVWPSLHRRPGVANLAYVVPILLICLPLLNLVKTPDRTRTVVCMAAGRYPTMAVVSQHGRTLVINAGDYFTGERLVFSVVRSIGGTSVDTAIIAGSAPCAGTEGLVGLGERMALGPCYLPVVPATPDKLLDEIGDSYLLKQAVAGMGWATAYETGYRRLVEFAGEKEIPLRPISTGLLYEWQDLDVNALPVPDKLPERFAASARTVRLSMTTRGFRWLIITDGVSPGVGKDIRPPYDIVVLPDFSSRRSYSRMIDEVVAAAQPAVVIVSGTMESENFDFSAWVRKHKGVTLLRTVRDGAIIATFPEAALMELKGYNSGRIVAVKPR